MGLQDKYLMKTVACCPILANNFKCIYFYLIIILTFAISCKKQVVNDQENINYYGSIENSYEKYGDSLNELGVNSESALPHFISEYYPELKEMEKLGLHRSKATVYSDILNTVDIDILNILISKLARKDSINNIEKLVLEEAIHKTGNR